MYVPHTGTPTIGSRRLVARKPNVKASTVRVTFPATPVLFAEEQSWLGTHDRSNVDYMPTVADVAQNPLDASQASGPYETPIVRRESERNGLCLRGLNLRYEFWEMVTLRVPPQEAQLLSGLKGNASAFEFLTEEYRETTVESPYRQHASTPSSYGWKLQFYCSIDVQ